MDHFAYKNGTLHAENVALAEIASTVGTPFYVYSTATLLRHYRVFDESFASVPHRICFAVKANSNIAVLKTLGVAGSGADVVSEGEIRRALAASIDPQKIVFSGMGKTRGEMAFALKTGVGQFNVESVEELEMLSEVATSLELSANIALRVNPDVDAGTHEKITTGRKTDKFGIAIDLAPAIYAKAAALPNINVVGISTHIGSQLTDLEPFTQAFARVKSLLGQLRSEGHAITILDLGGGLGIPYKEGAAPPTPQEYAKAVLSVVAPTDCTLVFEPGRLICGNAGLLVTSVILVKRTPYRNFLVVDAGMNDLARPSLYDAHHSIMPLQESKLKGKLQVMDVVGPVCETSDILAKQRELPAMSEGDILAFRSGGAYGAVMSSTYNSRPLIAEVMVSGDEFATIRPRQTYEELLGQDKLPEWL